jgi:hypothetical protein
MAAEQQARIAMKWLENVHLSPAGGPQHFSVSVALTPIFC